MKITVYTTTDCQFSKQEKEYLAANNLQYEEKNLETNKEFLTEMLAISNNFAGTPVTRVEKDDGTIAVLKGFTKEEFDTTLNLTPTTPSVTQDTPKVEEPVKTEETPAPTPMTTEPNNPIPPVTNNEAPEQTPPPVDEKLGSVLDKLEDKTNVAGTQPAEPTQPTETVIPPTTPPVNAPSVPDFPADNKVTV